MAVLGKANFHTADICKSNDQGEKLIEILIFSKLPKLLLGFKKKKCSSYYRILFTLKNIT